MMDAMEYNTTSQHSNKEIDLISMAVHQLRNPLTRNKWSLDLLIHDSDSHFSAEEKELLRKIYEDNERAILMVNDVLRADYADTESAKPSSIKVNIIELIEKTIHEVESDAFGKNITCTFVKPKVALFVLADPNTLIYAFENLLLNAIRYTPQGGSISVTADQEGDTVKVSVEDNGIGIPESEKSYIFQKFYRASNARKVETDGTGLGLFITRRIIEEYGGKIWFESVENQGTTFWLSFPGITVV